MDGLTRVLERARHTPVHWGHHGAGLSVVGAEGPASAEPRAAPFTQDGP